MRACRTASIVAFGALFAAVAIAACRGEPPQPNVPPVTTAHPPPATEPLPSEGADVGGAEASSAQTAVTLLDGPKKLDAPVCSRVLIALAKGTAKVAGETLSPGDALVLLYPDAVDVQLTGLGVSVVKAVADCSVRSKPAMVKTLIRAKDAPELRWAGGAARAHLDVGSKVSPDVYLGRLEAAVSVPEHDHATSDETIVAIEGGGTFTLDGKEHRLQARQIVHVPKKTKHSFKPDPGTRLVAIQLYEPPGPEQRFIALAAAEKDAGSDSGRP